MKTAITTPDSSRAATLVTFASAGSAGSAARAAAEAPAVAAGGPYWEAPRLAFGLTAAVAGQDHAAIAEAWDGLDSRGLADLVTCLGAHARQAARAAGLMRGDAAASPARQLMALHHLSDPPASDLACTAIRSGVFRRPAAPDPAAEPALREAALCLAGVIIATLAGAGWPRPYVAGRCRRMAGAC